MTDLRQEVPSPDVRVTRLRRLLADRRVRYVLVGGVSTVVAYGLFLIGYLLVGERLPLSRGLSADVIALAANIVTAVLVFPLYRSVVFGADGSWLQGFLRFYVVAFWSLLWSLAGLPLLIELADMPALLAQALIIAVVPILNYQILKFWTFRRRS